MFKKILLLSAMLSAANLGFSMEDRRQEELQESVRLADQLITRRMNEGQRSFIIDALLRVESADRATFVEQAKKLITRNTTWKDRASIINVLSDMNKAGREVFMGQVNQVVMHTDIIDSMDLMRQRSLAAAALSRVNAADRAEFIAQMHQFIKIRIVDSKEYESFNKDYVDILEVISWVDDPAVFVKQATQLITETISMQERLFIIRAFSGTNEAGRSALIDQAKQFAAERGEAWMYRSFVYALLRVEATDRERLMGQTKQLITQKMNADFCLDIIDALSSVDAADRAAFVNQVKQLAPEERGERFRLNTIKNLSRLKAADRAAFVNQGIADVNTEQLTPSAERSPAAFCVRLPNGSYSGSCAGL